MFKEETVLDAPEISTFPNLQQVVRPMPKAPEKISWEAFQRRYLTREDTYKYEWVGGFVEKTTRSIDINQIHILNNLVNFMASLKMVSPVDGNLFSEIDTFFAGVHRRPDIGFFTTEQIMAAQNGGEAVPDFVIEVISKNDQMLKVREKMKDYRRANVKVIWHVFPQGREVHVYHGKQMTVCTDPEDLCSAEPVIPGFVLPLGEVFK